MVGGGTAFGSILGALVGGGNGAAIGALSGAVGGGAFQMFTRGKAVKVPAEAVLTFRLEKPLNLYRVR
jgi:outer membrane lipoprotein SlyB